MKNIFLLIFVIAVFPFGNAAGAEYKYVDHSANDHFENGKVEFVLDTSSREIRSLDVINSVSFCKDGEEFICFKASWINFSLPKGKISSGNHWEHDGIAFEVLRDEALKMLGVCKRVWVIKAIRPDSQEHVQFFYYSEQTGLLAIKDVGQPNGPAQFFVVSGSRGFPQ